jgi:hypothetical protein
MSNFQILGTGCCGFLRAYEMLKPYVNIQYKGGKRKYQNGFQVWDYENGLIWDSESLSSESRELRVLNNTLNYNISHITIKYITEFIKTDPNIKFMCLKGQKEHSIKSLLTSWGYSNPCFVKERGLGISKNRYPVDQFPNFSFMQNELEATEKYWEVYYELADKFSKIYPENFLVVDSVKFFSDEEYQKNSMKFIGLEIPFYKNPVDLESFEISTALHGGLGNNLFQIFEVVCFCEKYKLGSPFFGTWDLFNNQRFPRFYDCDIFLGGHDGFQSDMKNLFLSFDWRNNLKSNFDIKFMINDMFRFGNIDNHNDSLKYLDTGGDEMKNTAFLHLRFCTRPADTHVKYVDDSFYFKCLPQIPENVRILIFSDDNGKAKEKINWFRQNFNHSFELVEINDCFESLKVMSTCEYSILHSSTFSFWGALLLSHRINKKVFYPEAFLAHGDKMISQSWGWKLL